ncbi:MAG TPA: hypothetical protein G4O01_03290 [Dehalococcoidia bacterium]|nr:hypothetical protein [Dehalococcoidia bacterium]
MKKKIHKIWGVGVVLVLVASLLFAAAPVSAGTLSWSSESIPSDTGKVLASGSDVSDLAVSADGQTIWATDTATPGLYKSTDGGATWSAKTISGATTPQLVAIAPDDPDIVAVVADNYEVYVTTNGGTSWGSLGTVAESGGASATNLYDITISQDDSGTHYIAVVGIETGGLANVWYWNLGAAAPVWKEANDLTGFTGGTSARAVAFSPNFASDKVMVIVSENDTAGTDYIYFQILSLSTKQWNSSAGFTSYPVTMVSGTGLNGLTSASISLSPDYLGSDDSTRIAFVGLDIAGGDTNSGIYRLKDTSQKALKTGVAVKSVAYDGTNLVAGSGDSNATYYSSDPLASSPSVSTTSSLKRAGLGGPVVVAWAGSDVVAGYSGDDSCFAISRDNGKSFNGLSLVDASLTVEDFAISADAGTIYLGTNDGADFSLWRKASSWERVLVLDGKTGMIVRMAPDDPNSVYVADQGTTSMWYSNAGGDTKWFQRSSGYNIQDVAVESADVLYIGVSGAATVSKSTNAGFTWGSAKSTGLVLGNVHMIKSLGEDKLIVGGTTGYVAYSTDGNSSWTKIKKQVNSSSNPVQVTASGLADGDFIYAGTSGTGENIVRWEIGSSTSWSDIINGTLTATTAMGLYGLELYNGVLYALASDGTDSAIFRTLSPSTATSSTTWSYKETTLADNVALNDTPQGLFITSGSTKLWALDTGNNKLYSFTDTLAEAGPTLSAPADGAIIPVNTVSGSAYSVSITWERPSKATKYDYQFALDSDFDEKLSIGTGQVSSTSSTVAYVAPGSNFMPGTTYYWRVRVASDGPLYSPWSEVRSFTVEDLPEPQPPVTIEPAPPAPVIEVPPPPPITLQPPEITLPEPTITLPQPTIQLPPAPAPVAPVPDWAIYAIIIIGAVLVIAVIVLIVRTRRPV